MSVSRIEVSSVLPLRKLFESHGAFEKVAPSIWSSQRLFGAPILEVEGTPQDTARVVFSDGSAHDICPLDQSAVEQLHSIFAAATGG